MNRNMLKFTTIITITIHIIITAKTRGIHLTVVTKTITQFILLQMRCTTPLPGRVFTLTRRRNFKKRQGQWMYSFQSLTGFFYLT
ncbi:MAG TPA: hypothetical protein VFO54_05305 [Chryseosolibacter sp.]|nr:hypothetical protein [Chryseosolibacter sp.]